LAPKDLDLFQCHPNPADLVEGKVVNESCLASWQDFSHILKALIHLFPKAFIVARRDSIASCIAVGAEGPRATTAPHARN